MSVAPKRQCMVADGSAKGTRTQSRPEAKVHKCVVVSFEWIADDCMPRHKADSGHGGVPDGKKGRRRDVGVGCVIGDDEEWLKYSCLLYRH